MRIIAGTWRGRPLHTPPDEKRSIRPTSDRARTAVFNILYSGWQLPQAETMVADLCCGTGALGFEALSRGAAHATFVDHNRAALQLVQGSSLDFAATTRTHVMYGDVKNLPPAPRAHSLIFLDAPYQMGVTEPALQGLATQGWLAPQAVLVVELAARENISVPAAYQLYDERIYGAAKFLFLGYDAI